MKKIIDAFHAKMAAFTLPKMSIGALSVLIVSMLMLFGKAVGLNPYLVGIIGFGISSISGKLWDSGTMVEGGKIPRPHINMIAILMFLSELVGYFIDHPKADGSYFLPMDQLNAWAALILMVLRQYQSSPAPAGETPSSN